MKKLNRNVFLFLVLIFVFQTGFTQVKPINKHEIEAKELFNRSISSVNDRAIGLLDKGQLGNMISNIGIVSDQHFGTPAFHWPREGESVQQYGFGVSFLLLADGQLMSSIYDPSSASTDFTWEAYDGSNGLYFNENRTDENTSTDGTTPFLASSDRRSTWPTDNGVPTWPGLFRTDLAHPENVVDGEFTSDRDVYAVLQDKRGLNLRVEQIGYSYSRPYAEDIVIIRYRIHNDGSTDLNEVYAGLQADLKPDFYDDDRVGAWTIGDETTPSFIFKNDLNGVPQRQDSSEFEEWVGDLGWIGVGMVDSPDDAGVTSFHYYHDDNSPVTDETFAGLMQNDPTGLEHPEWYFHGDDNSFADISLQSEVDNNNLPGTEITYTFASGPFDIPVGNFEEVAFAFVIGADSTDLLQNVETAYFMAKDKHYQGSGPPDLPTLYGKAGDGRVFLSWDNVAESSVDAITNEVDFEGYRLYKSTDGGENWGAVITNWYGDPMGFAPIYQCDIIDSITGLDPAYGPDFPAAHAWLGDDTGLTHNFVDTDVTNGIEVWYSITAYDRGVYNHDFPDSTESSYQTGIGISEFDKNIVVVTPGTNPVDEVPGTLSGIVEINGALAEGRLELEILDQSLLSGHTYQITFNEAGDSVMVDGVLVEAVETTLNLYDMDRASDQFTDMLSGETFTYKNIGMSGDDLPAVDGFRIYAENLTGPGVSSMRWETVNNVECSFDWWTENRYAANPSSYEEVVESLDDWRITITDTPVEFRTTTVGFDIGIQDTTFLAPLKIEKTSYPDLETWMDVTEHFLLSDLAFAFGEIPSLSPLGWDLIPGGAAWNPATDPVNGPLFPDIMVLRDDEVDSTGSLIWLKTNNGPADAIAPSVGDEYYLRTNKPFNKQLVYQFTTEVPASVSSPNLSRIKAVPNPVIVRSGFENDPNDPRVMFTHLPRNCTITIYTVAGSIVQEIDHRGADNDGFDYWDLRNEHGQDVAYGLYVYVVKDDHGNTHTGKVMVIR